MNECSKRMNLPFPGLLNPTSDTARRQRLPLAPLNAMNPGLLESAVVSAKWLRASACRRSQIVELPVRLQIQPSSASWHTMCK